MLHNQRTLKAEAYRRKAAMCDGYVTHAQSGADRQRLLRMRDNWLVRAANEIWLDGLPPTPPAKALALAVTG